MKREQQVVSNLMRIERVLDKLKYGEVELQVHELFQITYGTPGESLISSYLQLATSQLNSPRAAKLDCG